MDFVSVAARYSGRISYLPAFFEKAVELFGLSKSSTILDLGCGTGALAFGFAPCCQSVLAVDKSADMLSQRVETPDNVRFLLADLNAETTSLPVRADLVVIGNAIHFFEREKLIPLLNAVTTPSASVLVCGTTISPRTPWSAPYKRLRMRYSTLKAPLDVEGTARFAATEWSRGRNLRVVERRPFSVRDLLDHALSYPSSVDAILRNKDEFERSLEALLAPHYKIPNHAVVEVLNWGLEYKRG
jgi:SAM-dependent methyltransferase